MTATHSRLGDVRAALENADGQATTLTSGEALGLSFQIPSASTSGRAYFLLAKGVPVAFKAPATGTRAVGTHDPPAFALLQNHPNPLESSTTIHFALPTRERVRIELFDPQGRQVRRLVDREFAPGRWSVDWDRRGQGGGPVPAGLYLYRITAGSFRAVRKLVVLP